VTEELTVDDVDGEMVAVPQEDIETVGDALFDTVDVTDSEPEIVGDDVVLIVPEELKLVESDELTELVRDGEIVAVPHADSVTFGDALFVTVGDTDSEPEPVVDAVVRLFDTVALKLAVIEELTVDDVDGEMVAELHIDVVEFGDALFVTVDDPDSELVIVGDDVVLIVVDELKLVESDGLKELVRDGEMVAVPLTDIVEFGDALFVTVGDADSEPEPVADGVVPL